MSRSLDREITSLYHLNISASDHGMPSLTSQVIVTVTVFDVNDNPPEFVTSLYTASVLENQPPGLSVAVVSATDFDDATCK